MCIRKDAGKFVPAKIDWFAPLYDVDVREAIGLHTTLQLVSDLQFDNMNFALDSKRVVDCVNSNVYDISEFGCIISACRRLLENSFQNFHVEFNRRQVNRIVHQLAHTRPLDPSPYIIDDAPSYF